MSSDGNSIKAVDHQLNENVERWKKNLQKERIQGGPWIGKRGKM